MRILIEYFKPVFDVFFTILAWIYFLYAYFIFFYLFFPILRLSGKSREDGFQKINCLFFRVFFQLIKLIPGIRMHISGNVRSIRSSVIVGNHVSYLDPILLISLFDKQKTIVKPEIFRIPLFGNTLRISGYLAPSSPNNYDERVVRSLETLNRFLEKGGNLFVFPEGTRSRNQSIGRFNKGAFKIARNREAPVSVVFIRNTDQLFKPGSFWFNTLTPVNISVEWIDTFHPDYGSPDFDLDEFIEQVRSSMKSKTAYRS